MDQELKKDVLENLSYAAKDFIRDAKLHNVADWDSMTEDLTNFLFAKAEVWISDKCTEVEAELQRKCDEAMEATLRLDDPRLVGVA